MIDDLKQLDQKLSDPLWDQLVMQIGRSLPQDVWLDHIQVGEFGKVTIRGKGYHEEAIFEFVRWLKRAESIEHAELAGTRPGRSRSGKVVIFDVEAKMNRLNNVNQELGQTKKTKVKQES